MLSKRQARSSTHLLTGIHTGAVLPGASRKVTDAAPAGCPFICSPSSVPLKMTSVDCLQG